MYCSYYHSSICHPLTRSLTQPQIEPSKSNLFFPTKFKFWGRSSMSPTPTPRAGAGAGSVSGYGADYSEQLLGTQRKQKRQSVAGIDQDELLDPEMLADADSCFCNFKGVQIHHKICHEEEEEEQQEAHHSIQLHSSHPSTSVAKKIGLPMVLLHGFGASVFSWNRVMKPLSQLVGAKVLSFDRPAFGLTSRVSFMEHSSSSSEDSAPLNPYSMAFSVLATLSFIDLLAAEKAILIGHSAGCLVAVDTYFEAPERVAALVLIAPAILAPIVPRKATRENQMTKDKQIVDGISDSNFPENPFVRIWKALSNFCMHIVKVAMQMMKGMMDMVRTLYRKALSAILRSTFAIVLVRMIIDKFGIPAIRNSWCDANQINDHVLDGYTKPLRVKGWDKALLEYILAMVTDSASEPKPPLANRLTEISCPVLIITGDKDRIVPSWNAERLSQAIPGSNFELIKNCGHLPHEERVEEFLLAVEKFLWKVFGTQEQILQATA
eukprot:TRINITY_DN4657_c0_g2_i1.p1 TRINITY_DN4657_c0_g2~~TRINITY_DN4657_c0_g2_i1.p1  ORF type:complete len:493 (+),score=100.79 TRINITY_DN4657_c0_g2_i1:68-1546(+)